MKYPLKRGKEALCRKRYISGDHQGEEERLEKLKSGRSHFFDI